MIISDNRTGKMRNAKYCYIIICVSSNESLNVIEISQYNGEALNILNRIRDNTSVL